MAGKNRPPINPPEPASILRRAPTNNRNPALNPAPPFYYVKGANRDYADVFVPEYENRPQYVASPHNIQQTYYTGHHPSAVQEDNNINNDDTEEVYENEEELVHIDNVPSEAAGETGENVVFQDRAETNAENKIAYVKPQGKLKTAIKKQGVLSEVSAQKAIEPVLYDSRMARNTEWLNAGNIAEANPNTSDIKQTDVIAPRLTPRKSRYTYQGTDFNQISNFNQYIQDRNTEAWIKYHDAIKRAQSRSPTRKAVPPKQPLSKFCVGAEDSPSVEGIEQILGEMESNEMFTIKRDLKDFQKARRRLIYDATNIKPMFSYPRKQ